MKVLLILVDGMRPDSFTNIEKAQKFISKSSYLPNATTVYPPVTLPAHVSLFRSVPPEIHGTVDNFFVHKTKPVVDLCEMLDANYKHCAFFYDWEELRDVSRPFNLTFSYFMKMDFMGGAYADTKLTDECIKFLKEYDMDFTFLYLGNPDEVGHHKGWMSPEYLKAIEISWDNIDRIVNELGDEYTVFVTADHGGHDHDHGDNVPEDMLIPLMIKGPYFPAGKKLNSDATIMDIAPTVTKLLNVAPNEEWKGKPIYYVK